MSSLQNYTTQELLTELESRGGFTHTAITRTDIYYVGLNDIKGFEQYMSKSSIERAKKDLFYKILTRNTELKLKCGSWHNKDSSVIMGDSSYVRKFLLKSLEPIRGNLEGKKKR